MKKMIRNEIYKGVNKLAKEGNERGMLELIYANERIAAKLEKGE